MKWKVPVKHFTEYQIQWLTQGKELVQLLEMCTELAAF